MCKNKNLAELTDEALVLHHNGLQLQLEQICPRHTTSLPALVRFFNNATALFIFNLINASTTLSLCKNKNLAELKDEVVQLHNRGSHLQLEPDDLIIRHDEKTYFTILIVQIDYLYSS